MNEAISQSGVAPPAFDEQSPSPGRPTGPTVNARDHIAPGTSFHAMIGGILGLGGAVIGALVLAAATFGVGLIILAIAGIVYFGKLKQRKAIIHGSAIKVGPDQFDTVYKLVAKTAQRLNMSVVPDTYIVESNEQNAAAIKTRGQQVLMLSDDMIWGAMTTKDPAVLEFVIAHELAHHKLGHSGLLRGAMSSAHKTLSRLDEFTCDGVAAEVVGKTESSVKALALLTIGPQLLPKVNLERLVSQAKGVAANKVSRKAEKQMTHPLLLRRMARILGEKIKCA
jgi:Zn-dependent protease with chaperone function